MSRQLEAGLVHLLFGMGIKFYMLWVTSHPFAAIYPTWVAGIWYMPDIGLYFLNPTAGFSRRGRGRADAMSSRKVGMLKIRFVRLGKRRVEPVRYRQLQADLCLTFASWRWAWHPGYSGKEKNNLTLFGPSIVISIDGNIICCS